MYFWRTMMRTCPFYVFFWNNLNRLGCVCISYIVYNFTIFFKWFVTIFSLRNKKKFFTRERKSYRSTEPYKLYVFLFLFLFCLFHFAVIFVIFVILHFGLEVRTLVDKVPSFYFLFLKFWSLYLWGIQLASTSINVV